jgi:hypothetical protein
MQTKAMIVCCALTALHLLQQPSSASFFEMTLERNSIYTPSDMNMVMQLGDEATAEGKYSFKVSVLVGETVIREKPGRTVYQWPVHRSPRKTVNPMAAFGSYRKTAERQVDMGLRYIRSPSEDI